MSTWQTQGEPVVTVLCATYNHFSYIEDALCGVLGQVTSFPFQLIVRDDASSDGTAEIVRRYVAWYPNVIIPVLEPRNTYSKGIRPGPQMMALAKSEFIAVCEGDDYWTDCNKLEIQVSALRRHEGIDMSCHPCVILNDRTNRQTIDGYHRFLTGVVPLEKVIKGGGAFIPTASLLIRSVAMKAPVIWDNACPVGDYFQQIYGAKRSGALYVNTPMSVYRTGQSGAWTTTIKDPNRLRAFDMGFIEAVKQAEVDFPKYVNCFDSLIVWSFMHRVVQCEESGNQDLAEHAQKVLAERLTNSGMLYKLLLFWFRYRWTWPYLEKLNAFRGLLNRAKQRFRALAIGMFWKSQEQGSEDRPGLSKLSSKARRKKVII